MKKIPDKIFKFILGKVVAETLLEEFEFSEYLDNIYEEILYFAEENFATKENMLEQLIDITNRSSLLYENLTTKIAQALKINDSSYVKIREDSGRFYLKSLLNLADGDDVKINEYINQLDNWLQDTKKYSEQYEEFVSKFFKDYGLDAVERTRRSGDSGIDIICRNSVGEDFLGLETMYILCQVKLYNHKADQPVIRRIIADSILISFETDIYPDVNQVPKRLIVVSHNGFSEGAKKYAASKGVSLLDTKKIFKWIALQQDLRDLECIKFLEALSHK